MSLLPHGQVTHGGPLLSDPLAATSAPAKDGVAAPLPGASRGPDATGVETRETPQTLAVGLSTARLLQGAANSEMRVGLRLGEFGNVSIRTSVEHHQISAHISLDHDALGQMLGSQTRTMEQRIGEAYGVKAAVSVVSGGFSGHGQSSGGHAGGGGQNSRQAPSQLRFSGLPHANEAGAETGRQMPGAISAGLGESRLSIRI